MRRALWILLLSLQLLPLSAAWAKGRVQEFKPPDEQEQQDTEDKKGVPKTRMGRFREDALTAIEPEKPFPWRMLGLAVFVLGVGGFVGWRYYREMSEELPDESPAQRTKKKKRKKKDTDADEGDAEPADG